MLTYNCSRDAVERSHDAMNLPLSNPPAGWQVSEDKDSVSIRRTVPESAGWPLAAALAGTLVIVSAVTAFQMVFASQSLFGAVFSGTTVVALLPALGIYLLARRGKSKPASDWSYTVQQDLLTVESRFGNQREQTRVERSRVIRLHRTRESEPGTKDGEAVYLNAHVEKVGGIREEAYLGVFRSPSEAEWFCALVEAWSGRRVNDLSSEAMAEPEEPLSQETPPT